MSAAAASSERRIKTLTRKLDLAEDENAALKDKLAQARKRNRVLSRGAVMPSETGLVAQELSFAREEQESTRQVLRIISESHSDASLVFEAINASIRHLFDGFDVAVWRVEHDELKPMAVGGNTVYGPPRASLPLRPEYAFTQAVVDAKVVKIDDAVTDRSISEAFRQHQLSRDRRSVLYAPLIKSGTAIGLIGISRTVPTSFTPNQVRLAETFAAQAVIAIENARLFNELETRNKEVAESLARQTATSKILGLISGSPGDLESVLKGIAEQAALVCNAGDAGIDLVEGELFRYCAHYGELSSALPIGSLRPYTMDTVRGRAILERQTIHIHDLASANNTDLARGQARGQQIGQRTTLSTPLLREDKALGVITIRRTEVQPFTEEQINALQSFANQAVIAIENARIFNELEQRNKELAETLDHQTATAEILRIISSSPTDTKPVFDAIAEGAARHFKGFGVSVALVHGDSIESVAVGGGLGLPVPAPRPLVRRSIQGRAIIERKLLVVEDTDLEQDLDETVREIMQSTGRRAIITAPLVSGDEAFGLITVFSDKPYRFSAKQIALLKTFADQAVIAIQNARLFKELEARNKDLAETLEQQTATSEILKVISSSPTQLQHVLDTIAQSIKNLFGAFDSRIWLVNGDMLESVAVAAGVDTKTHFAVPLSRDYVGGHSILDQKVICIEDLESTTEVSEKARQLPLSIGARSLMGVPLIKDGKAIGAAGFTCKEPTRFSEKQIKLMMTFADQAVIAIENARLFNELEARNKDLAETLEQQSATSEVLRIISSSPTDQQPVFDAIAKSAHQLFDNAGVGINVLRDNMLNAVAFYGDERMIENARRIYPRPLDRESFLGVTVLEGRVINVVDFDAPLVPAPLRDLVRASGYRSLMGAPMMREGVAIGAIMVAGPKVGGYDEKQIALLRTFADQAVIAIENARLFNELEASNREQAETLQYQTATSEVLRIVSSSVSDPQPVYDAIQSSVERLFKGFLAVIWLADGDRAVPVAVGAGSAGVIAMPLNRENPPGVVILDAGAHWYDDIATDPRILAKDRELLLGLGRAAIAGVPLLRNGKAIGAITIASNKPTRFSDKQIALLKTFADQAVIAIENARLFNELQETIQHQTATSDVLRIVSSSVSDPQPVYDAIRTSVMRLFEGFNAVIWLATEDSVVPVTSSGPAPAKPRPLSRETPPGVIVLDAKAIWYDDIATDPHMPETIRNEMLAFGRHSAAGVPLLRQGKAIGAITIASAATTKFSDKQIALLQTFADQAVIAIENARLFNELQSSLEHQTATGELLRAISRASFDLPSLLQGLTATAARLCDANRCNIFRPDDEGNYRPFVQYGYDEVPEVLELLQREPLRIGRESAAGRSVLEKRAIHIPDISADTEFRRNDVMRILKFATLLAVPMLRDGEPIGVITMARGPEPRPFNEAHIKLVTAFADQAVIAIENVRLINEIQEKSAQLEIANRHKSEFLASMSHELRTPLNAIIGFSEVLSEKMFGEVNDKQMQYLKTINASGQHLLSLINDILDLAKIEAGRMDLDLTTFNVAAALDNAMTLIRERAGRQSVALEIQCDPELKEWTADERKFKQVMLNLLSNAVKFTPQGGRITVAAKRIDTGIEVSVTDTGVGIAPQDQAAVFEEFKQVGGDRLRKAEGTGLGLSLTRKFVELHGGQIGLASEPGKGSTFSFTLPESKREAA